MDKIAAAGFSVKKHTSLDTVSVIVHPVGTRQPFEVQFAADDVPDLVALLELAHRENQDEFLRAIEDVP